MTEAIVGALIGGLFTIAGVFLSHHLQARQGQQYARGKGPDASDGLRINTTDGKFKTRWQTEAIEAGAARAGKRMILYYLGWITIILVLLVMYWAVFVDPHIDASFWTFLFSLMGAAAFFFIVGRSR